jgi:hypothetical protein
VAVENRVEGDPLAQRGRPAKATSTHEYETKTFIARSIGADEACLQHHPLLALPRRPPPMPARCGRAESGTGRRHPPSAACTRGGHRRQATLRGAGFPGCLSPSDPTFFRRVLGFHNSAFLTMRARGALSPHRARTTRARPQAGCRPGPSGDARCCSHGARWPAPSLQPTRQCGDCKEVVAPTACRMTSKCVPVATEPRLLGVPAGTSEVSV